MATFFTDFDPAEGHTLGATPSGFSRKWGAIHTYEIAALAAAGDGYVVRRNANGTTSERSALGWDTVGAATDVILKGRFRVSSFLGARGIAVICGAGTAASMTGYVILHSNGTATLTKYNAGATSGGWSSIGSIASDTWYDFILERTGSTVRWKLWAAAGSEPGTWNGGSVDDPTPLSAGWVGVTSNTASGELYYDWLQADTPSTNTDPEVTIISPLDASEHEQGATVELRATATDDEDGDLTAAIEWSSDVDGALGTGGTVDVTTLSLGTHVLTASVEDADAATDSASVTITIVAAVPGTPTLTATPGLTSATLTGSAYSHANGRAHQATEFDLDGTIVPLGAVTSYLEEGLTEGTLYEGRRVRYQDEDDAWGEWSAPISYRTLRDVGADQSRPYLRLTAITAADAAFESGPFFPDDPETPTTIAGVRWRFGLLEDFDLETREFLPGESAIETTADLAADPGWESHTFTHAWVVGTKYVAQVAHQHSDEVWSVWGSPEIFEWVEIDPAEYTPLWDVTRGSWHLAPPYQGDVRRGYTAAVAGCPPDEGPPVCGGTEGYDAHRYPGVMMRGGVHDPAFLAYLPGGLGKQWRAAANVSIAGRGRWTGYQYDLSVRSLRAGVGVAGIGTGAVGETPTWWGFLATIQGASGEGPSDGRYGIGWGGSTLRIEFLDSADVYYGQPSSYGYAGRGVAQRALGMVGSYPVSAGAELNAGGYRWCGCGDADSMIENPLGGFSIMPVGYPDDPPAYRVEIEVTQESPGVVRVKARVATASTSAAAYSDLPPLDQDGWHINTLWGGVDLQCGYAGYAGRSVYDVASFRDAWATFSGLTAECLDDPLTCEGTDPPAWEPVPVPEYELSVVSVCGTVDIALLTGAAVDSLDIEIRRVDTLAVVYTGTSDDQAFSFAHGTHSLPYNTPLEVRGRYTTDSTPSEWTDWSAFLVTWELAECAQQPCSLYLICYLEDRLTVDWIVSTDADGAAPQYLIEPEHYGEQEVDFIEGRASIGEVVVAVIDPRQVPESQDTGWMTERLADTLARGAVQGRRMQLIRWVDAESPPVVIADGPAGAPRLRGSYAGFEWSIRDTRETERKFRAFSASGPTYAWWSAPPEVSEHFSTTVWPAGVLNGWGPIAATVPVVGEWQPGVPGPLGTIGNIDFSAHWSGTPGVGGPHTVDPSVVITTASERMLDSVSAADEFGIRNFSYPNIAMLWRLAGTTDPWNVYIPSRFTVGGDFAYPLASVYDALVGTDEVRAVGSIPDIGLGINAPATTEDIELILLYTGLPTEKTPVHVEGLTLGQFLVNLYSGVYSPRDSAGALVPSGIRYDEDALLELTEPVLLRLTEPIEDVREWAEKHGYAPVGYAPALDNLARISPMPQTLDPALVAGLTTLDNAIVSPRPEWSAGDAIINVVRFTYPRFYVPTEGEVDSVDGILVRQVEFEYRDEDSIDRHGLSDAEFDGRLFGATGDGAGAQIAEEAGMRLWAARHAALIPRYAYGAPVIHAPAMREYTSHLRAGDWCVVDLSWMPDYVTRQRGLLAYAQIVAIRDLNCAWRGITLELGAPEAAES